MRICGIKLTHDGAIALVEDGRLVFCIEQEKRGNNPRYLHIGNLDDIVVALAAQGLGPKDIDAYVIDGWPGDPQTRFGVVSGNQPVTLTAAPYLEPYASGLLAACEGSGLMLGREVLPYRSYPHVTGHLASAYCTSPFAQTGEPAVCLVWDGGIPPRLYHVERHEARFVESLFPVIGHAYVLAGHKFGPYKRSNRSGGGDRSIAGKVMAYIALGSFDEAVVAVFQELYEERVAADDRLGRNYRGEVGSIDYALAAWHDLLEVSIARLGDHSPENVLASFHCLLERMLVREMTAALQRHSYLPGIRNLCIAGGCGLNIKWNTTLRASGLFDAVWVPPFPNDSGSAIGAACSALAADRGFMPLEWSVYSGPALQRADVPSEWEASPCSMQELATILADNHPVVFLDGRAELGPRALGGRSILAAATSAAMKNHLNGIKCREHFRPVAPICLEDRAPEFFSPGTPDRYMLFEHQTLAELRNRIPAVVHLDGSARLQTVPRESRHTVARLLVEYERLTGLPLLCNTSANHHGCGFFPDVAAACRWGRVGHIWSEGLLWTRARVSETRHSG
ncbi:MULTISPECIES: nodulation protein NodU [Bradyrhizobium]|uniref:nodulation protein NodU n=1 Tax=Bradyrhizobium TaxID=374 RepID=UPI0010215011|nr:MULTISPECIES: nodulation protein NodU [Bradyrhizobium]MCW2117178.1 carbamoyltransferase [Bradyrhizobium elkanii]MCW2203669.1 carbamoyltransferase [Bradyrhizobium elkanii]MCW2233937.1 carbamoyltransferase [Bradyrhizobium elkanii]NLS70285.1 nodulation protein NodU [Bradyrhizobium brasilense]NWL39919.1 nodulation protein NodU [Bradyrhizobium elkanii]